MHLRGNLSRVWRSDRFFREPLVLIGLFVFVLPCIAPSAHASNDRRAFLIRQSQKESPIPGLVLNPGQVPIERDEAIVRGRFQKSNYRLAINGRYLKMAQDQFEVHIPLSGPRTRVLLQVVDEAGKVKNKQEWLIIIQGSGEARTRFSRFRLSEITVFQSGGSSFSGELSWNPAVHLWRNLSLQGNFGISSFKNQYGSNIFIVEFQALAALKFKKFTLEAGGGEQLWKDTNSSYFALSGNILYQFNSPVWRVIDSVFLGYTSVSIPSYPTQEIKVGVQMDL
jgi:hypothetical protein